MTSAQSLNLSELPLLFSKTETRIVPLSWALWDSVEKSPKHLVWHLMPNEAL